VLPGPVDPARLLALELVPGALANAAGLVQAKAALRSASARLSPPLLRKATPRLV
jgi:hypothetical protein